MTRLSGKEKAALFFLALGCEQSAKILSYLSDQEVESISCQIASMGKVSSRTLEQVLCEFMEARKSGEAAAYGGIEYTKNLLSKAFGAIKADEIVQKIAVVLRKKPLESSKKREPDRIASFLKYEQPKTIALVLAYLEPVLASEVLLRLPRGIQGDVARRIAMIDRTSPSDLYNLDRTLEQKLDAFGVSHRIRGGSSDSIAVQSGENARIVRFDDIAKLPDVVLGRCLADLSDGDIAKALRTASYEATSKILKNISQERAEALRKINSAPVRLDAIENAQNDILRAVRKYQEQL